MRIGLRYKFALYLCVLMALGLLAAIGYYFVLHRNIEATVGLEEGRRSSMVIFDEINASMRLGGGRAENRAVIERLSKLEDIRDIRIIHGPSVDRQYGVEEDEQATDDLDMAALAGERAEEIFREPEHAARVVTPFFFKKECLGCHNAEVGEVAGAISITVTLGALSELLHKYFYYSILFSFLILLIIAIASLLIVRKSILTPLRRLKTGADTLSGGNLSYRVALKTGDEMEALGSAFDSMGESLLKARDSLEEAKSETDRKAAEVAVKSLQLGKKTAELEGLLKRHASIVETAADAIVLRTIEPPVITDANPAAERITGYSKDELIGMNPDRLHTGRWLKEYKDSVGLWLKAGRGYLHDTVIRCKDGREMPVEIAASIFDSDGKRYLLEITRDLSERKEFEAAIKSHAKDLEEKVQERTKELDASIKELGDSRMAVMNILEDVETSRKEWAETFDAITDPLFIHDSNFRVVRANTTYARLAECPIKEVIGRPYYEVFPKRKGPFNMCLSALKKSIKNEEEEEISLPHIGKIFKVRYYPITDTHGDYRYSIHILEDITDIKIAEKRVQEEAYISESLLALSSATQETVNIEAFFVNAAASCTSILGADFTLVYLWNKEMGRYHPVESNGLEPHLVPLFRSTELKRDDALLKELTDRPFIIEKDEAATIIPDVAALAVLPLLSDGEPLGLIIAGFYFNKARAFGLRDIALMEGITNQVSVALREAELYRDVLRKTVELSGKIETIHVQNEIDRAILSTLDSSEILETVALMINRLIPSECVSALLADHDNSDFVATAGSGLKILSKGDRIPFEETSGYDVLKDKRPQFIADLNNGEGGLPFEARLLKAGIVSGIRVPLIVKGEPIGVVSTYSVRPSGFTYDNLTTLETVADQLTVALENARLVTDLNELFMGTVRSLTEAIDAKSKWTSGHSNRVTETVVKLGRILGVKDEELTRLELAALLHDVGKIGTYESILDKPKKLTDEEYEVMKNHTTKGAEILMPVKQFADLIPAVKHHHECYDGRGYPDGIKGEDIPWFARIIGVADTVDAMMSDRPYRKGLSIEKVVAELSRCSSTQFDPKVVEAFLTLKEETEQV